MTIVDIARKHIQRYRAAQRAATEAATNFANEMFGSVLAIKVATTESPIVDRFRRLNDARRRVDPCRQSIHANAVLNQF